MLANFLAIDPSHVLLFPSLYFALPFRSRNSLWSDRFASASFFVLSPSVTFCVVDEDFIVPSFAVSLVRQHEFPFTLVDCSCRVPSSSLRVHRIRSLLFYAPRSPPSGIIIPFVDLLYTPTCSPSDRSSKERLVSLSSQCTPLMRWA